MDVSPALSQITDVPGPIDGRKIGVIADEKSDLAGIAKLRRALSNLGAELLVIAPSEERWVGAPTACLSTGRFSTCRSIEFDAVVVAGEVE